MLRVVLLILLVVITLLCLILDLLEYMCQYFYIGNGLFVERKNTQCLFLSVLCLENCVTSGSQLILSSQGVM